MDGEGLYELELELEPRAVRRADAVRVHLCIVGMLWPVFSHA